MADSNRIENVHGVPLITIAYRMQFNTIRYATRECKLASRSNSMDSVRKNDMRMQVCPPLNVMSESRATSGRPNNAGSGGASDDDDSGYNDDPYIAARRMIVD